MQHSDPLWEVPLQVVQEALVVNHKDQVGVEGQTGVLEDLVPETVHPATCVDHTAAVPVCVGRGGEGRGVQTALSPKRCREVQCSAT